MITIDEKITAWSQVNKEKKGYISARLAKENPDFMVESDNQEIMETIDMLIDRESREVSRLVNAGVQRYEAEIEAAKLVKLDTAYSILSDYLQDKYDVDIFDEEYIEKVRMISEKHKGYILEGDFDDLDLEKAIKSAFE